MIRQIGPVSTVFCQLDRRRGFALVATLTVMILLGLLAIAFLSLATVTVRTSNQDRAQEEARANARMALMIAMGQLQRELGPDQRISASADILAGKEGFVANPHWTGVWRTVQKDGRPVIVRDEVTGGLADTRDPNSIPSETRISYLVSGNEQGLRSRTGLKHEAEDVIQGQDVKIVGNG